MTISLSKSPLLLLLLLSTTLTLTSGHPMASTSAAADLHARAIPSTVPSGVCTAPTLNTTIDTTSAYSPTFADCLQVGENAVTTPEYFHSYIEYAESQGGWDRLMKYGSCVFAIRTEQRGNPVALVGGTRMNNNDIAVIIRDAIGLLRVEGGGIGTGTGLRWQARGEVLCDNSASGVGKVVKTEWALLRDMFGLV